MDELVRLLTLQDSTTRVVMAGTAVLAVAAAVVGTLAMLRRRALVGDAVAHASLPGICLAWLIAGDRGLAVLLLGAFVLGLACIGTIALVQRSSRAREDATTAIAIGGFFGLGIVLSRLIQNQPGGNRAGLDGFLFGKAASAVAGDAWLVLAVAVVVVGAVVALRKELALLCFDRAFAGGIGRPVHRFDALLLVLVALVTVAGLPSVGVVLMVAMLVIPPAAARFWSESLNTIMVVAAAIGGVSAVLGTGLSAVLPAPGGAAGGWPTGPIIVLTASSAFVFSLLIAPERGLLASILRRRRLRNSVHGAAGEVRR
jgi:manganese/zinc/iron transport system permease protein